MRTSSSSSSPDSSAATAAAAATAAVTVEVLESTETATIRWTVPDVSKIGQNGRPKVVALPRFRACGRAWQASLDLITGEKNSKKQLLPDLFRPYLRLCEGEAPIKASWEWGIVTKADEVVCENTSEVCEFPGRDGAWWGASDLCSRTEMLDELNGYILDDAVTIQLELSVVTKGGRTVPNTTTQMALTQLLASGTHSDVVLMCGDDDHDPVVRAHKCILAARSPVFKAMFEHKMSEALENKVVVDDVPAVTMRALLRYIYTGDLIRRNEPTLSALLVAGDRFQLPDLVTVCSLRLAPFLSGSNLATLLALAQKHNAPLLQAACLAYVKSRPAVLHEVRESAGYKLLDKAGVELLAFAFVPPKKGAKRKRDADDAGVHADKKPRLDAEFQAHLGQAPASV